MIALAFHTLWLILGLFAGTHIPRHGEYGAITRREGRQTFKATKTTKSQTLFSALWGYAASIQPDLLVCSSADKAVTDLP